MLKDAVESLVNMPWSRILPNIPNTERSVRKEQSVPRRSSETTQPHRTGADAESGPTLDVIEKAIQACDANLDSCEWHRSDILRRFNESRAEYQTQMDGINETDRQTYEYKLRLMEEFRTRTLKLGFKAPIGLDGSVSLVIPARGPTYDNMSGLPDLESTEPERRKLEDQR